MQVVASYQNGSNSAEYLIVLHHIVFCPLCGTGYVHQNTHNLQGTHSIQVLQSPTSMQASYSLEGKREGKPCLGFVDHCLSVNLSYDFFLFATIF